MEDWWGRQDRLEYELEKLAQAGYRYEAPHPIPATGPYDIRVFVVVDSAEVELGVTFPELYPYFRFQVRAPSLELHHHIAPDGTLCFIGRDPANWETKDTLARYLDERFRQVIEAGRADDPKDVYGLEEQQAEPVSEYFPYNGEGTVLVDGSWELPADEIAGEVVLGYTDQEPFVISAAVIQLRDHNGKTIAQLDERLAARFRHRIRGRWVRALEEPPLEPTAFVRWIRERDPHGAPQRIDVPGGTQSFVGAAFPEESGWRKTQGIGWVFAIEVERKQKKKRGKRIAAIGPKKLVFLRAGRAGIRDLFERAPELRTLEHRQVAVFGLGCIGAPSVIAFAQAGCGHLKILDSDYVDASTILRWPVGLRAAGYRKAAIIEQVITADYPHTRIEAFHRDVGSVANGANALSSDLEVLEGMLKGSDVVYDATANLGVQHLLSDAAWRANIPYIGVSGTQGGWGGLVARVRPGETGCWMCLKLHQMDWEATGGKTGIPIPPGDEAGTVQPQGCGTPTFMAAGFDMTVIAMTAVRGAVEMLTAYPRAEWDALVIRFRDDAGTPHAPVFEPHLLTRHPDCPAC